MSKCETIIAECPPADHRQWDCQCARCGSSCDYERCYECEDGFSHHDCGEDVCCCLDKSPNVVCDTCGGDEGWHRCMSSPEWCKANPLPGRETVERGKLEWFVVEDGPDD